MVERNLAKVKVGSSRLLSRSRIPRNSHARSPSLLLFSVNYAAGWQSGHAAACKAVDAGSIPTPASSFLLAQFCGVTARVVKLVDTRDLKSLAG